jgi:endonuclease/exonuclease/phosphatase family metal-dependent hydrolase
VALVLLTLTAAACSPSGSDADGTAGAGAARDDATLTVLTRNLYLGADLAPLFEATAADLGTVARATYDQLVASDVEARMAALAGEIAAAEPDVVALQEATLWRQQPQGATAPVELYDFLALLLAGLEDRDVPYTVAGSVDGFSGGLPVPDVGVVTMQDRDVILVRDGGPVEVTGPAESGAFESRLTVNIAGADIEVVRGWTAVEATLDGRAFRFVATHLEAFDDDVRDRQLDELLAVAAGDPNQPTLLLGDLNSASDGVGDEAYRAALDAGFEDAWSAAGDATRGGEATCCYDADLTAGALDVRIDFVLVAGDFTVDRAEVVGTAASSRTASGRWASDHAGVLAVLGLAAG